MEAQYLNAKPEAEEEWSTSFFDCCSDLKIYCKTVWCPCMIYGQVADIVDRGSTTCTKAGAQYGSVATVTGCACLLSCFYRKKMRAQYNIKGNECGDCLKHFFFEACALSQLYRELKNRGFDMTLGWAANVEMQQNQGVAMTAPVFQVGMNR